jgi:aspartyl-tRNA(Asn)/glutamyl-tRNA(Gln) amidotransferase subunit A
MPALPDFCTAAELGRAYAAGRADPCEEVEKTLVACASADPALFITLMPQRAREEAKASAKRYDNGCPLGPLDGVPLVWKDLFDLAGTVTTAASLIYRHAPVAAHDCMVAARLQSCGMVSIGKVNLSEFAYSGLGLNPHFGTPLNPHDRSTPRAPGGSSSGTAVAVASGLVPVGIGTDTGGSIRVPAAFNGLVGYKPSTGRVDKTGVFVLSDSLDTIGPLAHTVEDCVLLDCAMRGLPATCPLPAPLQGLRVVVPSNVVFDDIEPDVAAALYRALHALAQAGVHIERRTLPELDEVQRITQAHGSLTAAEGYRRHRMVMESPQRQKIDPRVVSRLESGHTMSALDLLEIQSARTLLATRVAHSLGGAMVVMPTVGHVAPPIAPLEADETLFHRTNLLTLRNTMLGNFLDWCGLSLPMGCDRQGLPMGLLLSAPWGRDDALLAAGLAVQALLKREATASL